jgi:hypothetical protein
MPKGAARAFRSAQKLGSRPARLVLAAVIPSPIDHLSTIAAALGLN